MTKLLISLTCIALLTACGKSPSDDSPAGERPLERIDESKYQKDLWIGGGWISRPITENGVEFTVRAYFNEFTERVAVTMECKPRGGASIFASVEVGASFIGKWDQPGDRTVNGIAYAHRTVQIRGKATNDVTSSNGNRCGVSIQPIELRLSQVNDRMTIEGLVSETSFTRLY